jgi:hypothetical protein
MQQKEIFLIQCTSFLAFGKLKSFRDKQSSALPTMLPMLAESLKTFSKDS